MSMLVSEKNPTLEAQTMPLVNDGVLREALFRIADLTSRFYELEFELSQIRRVLLEMLEKSS